MIDASSMSGSVNATLTRDAYKRSVLSVTAPAAPVRLFKQVVANDGTLEAVKLPSIKSSSIKPRITAIRARSGAVVKLNLKQTADGKLKGYFRGALRTSDKLSFSYSFAITKGGKTTVIDTPVLKTGKIRIKK